MEDSPSKPGSNSLSSNRGCQHASPGDADFISQSRRIISLPANTAPLGA